MEKSTKIEKDPERGVNYRKVTTETEDEKVVKEIEVGWVEDTTLSTEVTKKK
jgi:hypothetical protein